MILVICADPWMRSNPEESAGTENFDLLLFAPNMFDSSTRKKAALLRPPRRQTKTEIPIGIAN